MTLVSTLDASSIDATGPINFISMFGSTITASTMTLDKTMNTSSMFASLMSTQILSFSSISMLPSTLIVSPPGPGVVIVGYMPINFGGGGYLGANRYYIPIYS